jgi:hypothetical protein
VSRESLDTRHAVLDFPSVLDTRYSGQWPVISLPYEARRAKWGDQVNSDEKVKGDEGRGSTTDN